MELYPLTPSQAKAFAFIEKTNSNVLLLGGPGVGKSVLINSLKELGKKPWVLTAPTGLAALNIDGRTLHSQFGIPSSGVIPPNFEDYKFTGKTYDFIRWHIKCLIIDEISMVRVDTLDYLDRKLRWIKDNNKPFGGIQVIIVGDFFQLPPVVKDTDVKELARHWSTPFAFSSKVFRTFKVIHLKKVMRQNDKVFLKLLEEARFGTVSPANMAHLNKRARDMDQYHIQLVARNHMAEVINDRALHKIRKKEYEFHADSSGDWPAFPVETVIPLKIGAKVMVRKNYADVKPGGAVDRSKIVNGTVGFVTKIEKESINIELKDGKEVTIYRQRWERKVKEPDPVTGRMEEKLKGLFTQLPVILAWAISMHKSQGQTFDEVHIDPRNVFAAGQLYVAISRCRTLKGITLEHRASAKYFMVDDDVLKFYSKL